MEQVQRPFDDHHRSRQQVDRAQLEQNGDHGHGRDGRREGGTGELSRVVMAGAAGVGRALFDAVRVVCAPAAVLTCLARRLPPLAGRMTRTAGEQQHSENGRGDP